MTVMAMAFAGCLHSLCGGKYSSNGFRAWAGGSARGNIHSQNLTGSGCGVSSGIFCRSDYEKSMALVRKGNPCRHQRRGGFVFL